MSEAGLAKLPNEQQIRMRLEGARWQAERAAAALEAGDRTQLESALCAAIDQALKAVTAALHGFNSLLPNPLPPDRVTRRNVRDRFVAVQASSAVLDLLDAETRPEEGWLWWLDRKEGSSAFASLIRPSDDPKVPPALWRDPLKPEYGVEPLRPDRYARSAVERVEQLVVEIGRLAAQDVAAYREAARRQPGRLL